MLSRVSEKDDANSRLLLESKTEIINLSKNLHKTTVDLQVRHSYIYINDDKHACEHKRICFKYRTCMCTNAENHLLESTHDR